LQDYSKAAIFDRIGMTESSWFLRGLDPSHIAMPYDSSLHPIGHYGYPNYPAGQLRTSAPQLARFLLMFAQNGQCGQRVLQERTVKEMSTRQFADVETDQGLIWFYESRGATTVLGHNGEDQGMSTDMYFDPTTGNGYVLLANAAVRSDKNVAQEAAFAAMGDKLMELANTLRIGGARDAVPRTLTRGDCRTNKEAWNTRSSPSRRASSKRSVRHSATKSAPPIRRSADRLRRTSRRTSRSALPRSSSVRRATSRKRSLRGWTSRASPLASRLPGPASSTSCSTTGISPA
jgi:hypothetical protein